MPAGRAAICTCRLYVGAVGWLSSFGVHSRVSTAFICLLGHVGCFRIGERNMNMKKMVFTTVFCLTALAIAFAADPNVGSWKLNEAKSKIPAGTAKNVTVVYAAVG